jgi:hypothetical protein
MMYRPTMTTMAMTKANIHPSVVRVVLEEEYDSYSKEKRPRRVQDRFRFEWQDEGTKQRRVVFDREP